MFFTVLPPRKSPSSNARDKAYLVTDNWNDWGKYNTQYSLVYVDKKGKERDIGSVKIGQFDMPAEQRRPDIPQRFDTLDEPFFSLGQDERYYDRLNKLGVSVRTRILSGLRDIAADEALFNRAVKEEVTSESLLRSVTASTVTGQYRRLAAGGAKLTRYKFKYTGPRPEAEGQLPISLTFSVRPGLQPPSNIHVLIGRNAVGKTFLLNRMVRALLERKASPEEVGEFSSDDEKVEWASLFANLVTVTFSAFDPYDPHPDREGTEEQVGYAYVGLKRVESARSQARTPKSPEMLRDEFVKSVSRCVVGAKAGRWRRALRTLEADPLFKEAEVARLADRFTEREVDEEQERIEDEALGAEAAVLFDRMSTGHKIVLLTITRLVEKVEEKTLVLLDEPESHLHPPLLAAFIRALSDLLIDRNGVAIIATHSPVVLQEVPSNCVWKLRKSGGAVVAERPEIETFGENVGILTREIFGLEVTQSGFHKMVSDAVKKDKDYEEVLERFGNQLGGEARAIARALLAALSAEQDG